MILNIIKKTLPTTEYYEQQTIKKQIVLHHTVSDGSADAVLNWWKNDGVRVATAYIVEKNGNIIEAFDPIYWSNHIGKGSTKQNNMSTIGIEIVNEGWLTKNNNGDFKWFDNKNKYKGSSIINYSWRGQNHWANYTDEQINSVALLCSQLCELFLIPKQILGTFDYNKEFFNYSGIVAHCNLRADKTDVSPAFSYSKLQNKLI